MTRAWVGLQLLLGWVSVWLLFAALIIAQHQPIGAWTAAVIALKAILPAALLGVLVHRFARRLPWPRPLRPTFLAIHLAAAVGYGLSWIAASYAIESLLAWQLVSPRGPGVVPFLMLGVWLYVVVAGVSYANEATARAAHAEAEAARAQLSALRAQLHPHFLFNALHTVVQLIPEDPGRAAAAAERVAVLLRTTIEEDRDLVSVRSEWTFVSGYLDVERIRFGDRLRITSNVPDAVLDETVPAFSLQTLVENAVRHGAAPRAEPTEVAIAVTAEAGKVIVTVRDDGMGATEAQLAGGASGIARLRARLRALYGDAASLNLASTPGKGVLATLTVPSAATGE